MTLPIRPDELAARATIRTCRSCANFDPLKSLCRKSSPPWDVVTVEDYCADWVWRTNPRVCWNSGICEAERREYEAAQEPAPF